jgi:predicted metal-dependent enzyme (double-stranded beta helix superfamily)
MTYTLEAFCEDARAALKRNAGADGREEIRRMLEKLLKDEAFLAKECGPDAAPGIRTVYRDKETGFNVLVHIYAKGKTSPPHDHGKSWAVYGQAVGWTDMTLWRRKDDGTKEGHAELVEERKFRLNPGMAGRFDPGVIHSIHFEDGAKFVRVTGTDLDTIPTSRYDLAAQKVVAGRP